MYELPTMTLPEGPFAPAWESLAKIGVPRWYMDAKLGIFIHWGVYSVPAFGNEWYSRNMYVEGSKEFEHHVKTWGPQNKFGYKDFIPLFKAEKFDPEGWVDLFARAGAKYVVPVAEHHDGFAMYDSKLNRWNAKKMGPKRDIIGELAAAIRKKGLTFGLSNHRAEHWWFMDGGMKFDSDVRAKQHHDFYGPAEPNGSAPSTEYKNDWLLRACELVDLYQPELYYFDTWVERPPLGPFRRAFGAYYYNRANEWGKHVAINYKNDAFAPGSAVIDVERGQMGDIPPYFWQSDTAVGRKSWCHITDEDYKSSRSIICDLVDIVSKNGTMLLNIGPKADGTIPPEDTKILEEIGAWLKTNGEAIYGTRPWRVYGEGPTVVPEGHFTDAAEKQFTSDDFRFTTKGSTLYAICLGEAKTEMLIRSLGQNLKLDAKPVKNVRILGGQSVQWIQDASGLRVHIPEKLRGWGLTIAIER